MQNFRHHASKCITPTICLIFALGFIEADAVISTSSGMQTFSSLVRPEDVPTKLSRKGQTAKLSSKTFSVQLGVSNKADVVSHFVSNIPMMQSQFRYFEPSLEDTQWLSYTVPTNTLPELAPSKGSVIEAFPPIRQDIPLEDWDEQEKMLVAERTIKALPQEYTENIEVQRLRSPRDFRDQMYLYKGAVYGLSPAVAPTAYFPYKTSVPGLYLAGQTTFPGFGVGSSSISGIFAAEVLIQNS